VSAFVPFDAFWITTAALLVVSAGSLARLRRVHRGVWLELGAPRLLPTKGLSSSAALTRFYWSRRVAALHDPGLTPWVTALRILQIGLAAVLVALAEQVARAGG
jgi:hypothetical protein